MLQLREFSAGWWTRCALADVELTLREGESLALLGPGGSGKSSLLTVIEYIVLASGSPSPGLWWAGQWASTIAHCRRLSQRDDLLQSTARESLEHVGLSIDTPTWLPADEPNAAALLQDNLDRPVGEIADPLRRYIAFALVAHSGAPLLLFDEPLVRMCGGWARAAEAWLRQLHAAGQSLVLVTHHLPLARRVADHAMLLVHGEVIELAPAEDFFVRPQQERTRDFLKWGG